MLSLRAQLLDFMDSTPYAQAGVRLEVRVMAGWLERVFLPNPPRLAGPAPRPPPDSILVVKYDEARAIVDAEFVHPTFAEGVQQLVMRLKRYALS